MDNLFKLHSREEKEIEREGDGKKEIGQRVP